MDGYLYLGVGNSTNKKDAQTNAALDFCQYLVRIGSLNQSDLPKVTLSGEGGSGNSAPLPRGLIAPHQSMGLAFNEGKNDQSSMLPYNRGPPQAYLQHLDTLNRKMIEDVCHFVST